MTGILWIDCWLDGWNGGQMSGWLDGWDNRWKNPWVGFWLVGWRWISTGWNFYFMARCLNTDKINTDAQVWLIKIQGNLIINIAYLQM